MPRATPITARTRSTPRGTYQGPMPAVWRRTSCVTLALRGRGPANARTVSWSADVTRNRRGSPGRNQVGNTTGMRYAPPPAVSDRLPPVRRFVSVTTAPSRRTPPSPVTRPSSGPAGGRGHLVGLEGLAQAAPVRVHRRPVRPERHLRSRAGAVRGEELVPETVHAERERRVAWVSAARREEERQAGRVRRA